MLTSATSGLRILARRDEMTEVDWLKLLEERRLVVKKHLHDMTLKTLGELQFVNDYFGDHTLKRYSETLRLNQSDQFNLDTRGIFPVHDGNRLKRNVKHDSCQTVGGGIVPGRHEDFWGLTRDGIWIHVVVFITEHAQEYKYKGRYERVAQAQSAHITERRTDELPRLGFPPRQIWEQLGRAVKDWEKHRQHLLADASELARVVRAEEDLIDVVVGKTSR